MITHLFLEFFDACTRYPSSAWDGMRPAREHTNMKRIGLRSCLEENIGLWLRPKKVHLTLKDCLAAYCKIVVTGPRAAFSV
mmetsp:Transcript_17466/g.28018  ORF Transcript_17466/g.28018 Transcript_17466/m.28018 type:complete len:81 (+) Transcript_17466:425-667(+)